MGDTRQTRRLAAILAADVVGYSAMMSRDEAGTMAALARHRTDIFDPALARHNGRVVKLIGDGTLAEFASVVDAVNCAVEIQSAIHKAADSDGIVLRIGINLGDVIIDGDDIYGDGVNVAARLEPLAEPGGICIASIVNESAGNRVAAAFRDGGNVAVKNIDRPIRVWSWHPGQDAAASQRAPPIAVENPPAATPAIAVLPFDNMSGDAEQEYFSDGITEDIITDLSKIGGLTVIARNSSFAYKGKSPDIRAVGRELGVTSVLEGSVRRAGGRVRITAQLIDAASGAHLWADRFDRDLNDIFEVQDEVTNAIVAALKLRLGGPAAAGTKVPTHNMEAYDQFLRAWNFMGSADLDQAAFDMAKAALKRAVELDPDYAQAHAALGLIRNYGFHNRWSSDEPATIFDKAERDARRALALDPYEPVAYAALAEIETNRGNPAKAAAAVENAIHLNPNYDLALAFRGRISMYSGHPDRAVGDFEVVMRLNAGFSHQVLHYLGECHLLLGHFETAATMFRQRILMMPTTDSSRVLLACALGHLGEIDEARRVWGEIATVNPDYSFEAAFARMPFTSPEFSRSIPEGLAKAGLLPA